MSRILAAMTRRWNSVATSIASSARAIEMLERGSMGPWAKDAIWIVVEDVELTAAETRLVVLQFRSLEPPMPIPHRARDVNPRQGPQDSDKLTVGPNHG